ncbi:class I SAM-dependent methyltransferase [candidate division KSB1 bacterium]
MKSYYNEISSGYEELHREEQEKKLVIIKKELGRLNKNTLLLDVGCGTGITSDFDCVVYGVDPAQKLLDKAGKKPDFRICAEAENMPFEDNKFDIVISVTAIQNFHDIGKGLDEIKRVGKEKFVLSFLKKSGKKDLILEEIKKKFDVKKEIEEEKDVILFCS